MANLLLPPTFWLVLAAHVAAQTITQSEAPVLFQREDEGTVYAINPDGSDLRRLIDGIRPVTSPDGRFALVWRRRDIVRVSLGDGASVVVSEGGDYSWSPDGNYIAVQDGDGIYLVDREGTGRKLLYQDGAWHPVWSPADLSVIFFNRTWPNAFGPTDLFSVNVVTGEVRLVRARTFIPQIPYPGSPDGTRLLVSESGSENVRVMNLETGELVSIGPSGERVGAQRPAWSPDGKYIAFEVGDGMEGLYVADSEGQTITRLIPGRSEAAPGGAAWSPDGGEIAFHLRSWSTSTPSRIYIINADGTGMRRLAEGSWPKWAPMGSSSYETPSAPAPLTWGALKYQFGP